MDVKSLARRLSDFGLWVIALLLWFLAAPLIRWADPTAAIFDAGVLMAFVYAIVGILLALQVIWLILWLRFPGVYQFLDSSFTETFKNQSKCFKLKFSLALFACLLFAQVVLVVAVL